MVATSALAAPYDMSGAWGVTSGPYNSHWDVVQSAGTLQVTMSNWPQGFVFNGTIDEGTGAFSITMPQFYPTCGTNSLEGVVAADGQSFTGTQILWTYHCGPISFCPGCEQSVLGLVGSRCGNGELDAGEECDDSNGFDGDCCSSSCALDQPQTACQSDNNVCTDDVCNGAGTCTHAFNTAPCGGPNACGSSTCSSGSCVISASEPAGTPCDLDASVCTPDTCDGAGACQAGAAVTCAPCEICNATSGCVADTGATCDTTPGVMKIDVKLDGTGTGERLKLQIREFVSYEDMGDPRTTTDYRLCLYQRDGVSPDQVIADALVPAGGTCAGKPCWKPERSGFKYRNPEQTGAGITSIDIGAGKGFKMQGKGPNLPLPSALADPVTLISKVSARQNGVEKCWYHAIPRRSQTPNRYTGSYRP